jgi:hypothetical protein
MRAAAATATLVVLGAWARPARAQTFEVQSDTVAQGYEVASPWGDRVLGKRRVMTMLGLGAYNLQGDFEPFKPDYSVVLKMRLDADFGIEGEEEGFDVTTRNAFVPGLDKPGVDLMYGYVEGKNLGDGWFGFRVGRQYVTDMLGWWSFDGGLVKLTTPWYFQLEAYGGLEQRGGLPLSTSRFETQGVWRGGHGEVDGVDSDYPSYQFASQAPAFGVAAESNGPNWIKGRVDYRRVYNFGKAFTTQFPTASGSPQNGPAAIGGFETVEGLRISSDRLGVAGDAFIAEFGAVRGGLVYDLYNGLVSKAYGGIEFYPIPNLFVVGADFDYYVPTFDADSIWNWFAHNPSMTALARVAARPLDAPRAHWDISASGGAKLWLTDGDPATFGQGECSQNAGAVDECFRLGIDATSGGVDAATGLPIPSGADAAFARAEENRGTTISPDVLANLGTKFGWHTGAIGLDGMLQIGVGKDTLAPVQALGNVGPLATYDTSPNSGRRLGAYLWAKQSLADEILWLGGRVSVFNWLDPTRPEREATSFGYVLAPEVRPLRDLIRARVEWEHDINRLVGQRFRIVGVLSFHLEAP